MQKLHIQLVCLVLVLLVAASTIHADNNADRYNTLAEFSINEIRELRSLTEQYFVPFANTTHNMTLDVFKFAKEHIDTMSKQVDQHLTTLESRWQDSNQELATLRKALTETLFPELLQATLEHALDRAVWSWNGSNRAFQDLADQVHYGVGVVNGSLDTQVDKLIVTVNKLNSVAERALASLETGELAMRMLASFTAFMDKWDMTHNMADGHMTQFSQYINETLFFAIPKALDEASTKTQVLAEKLENRTSAMVQQLSENARDTYNDLKKEFQEARREFTDAWNENFRNAQASIQKLTIAFAVVLIVAVIALAIATTSGVCVGASCFYLVFLRKKEAKLEQENEETRSLLTGNRRFVPSTTTAPSFYTETINS